MGHIGHTSQKLHVNCVAHLTIMTYMTYLTFMTYMTFPYLETKFRLLVQVPTKVYLALHGYRRFSHFIFYQPIPSP